MGAIANAKKQPKCAVKRKGGLPLALVIARYFFYVLAVVGLLAAALLLLFSLMVSSGAAYMASYADEHAGSMVEMLESGEVQPADIPACYRWVVFDAAQAAVASDMSERDQEIAGEALRQGSGVVGEGGPLGTSRRQVTAVLPDGSTCALQYDFLPVFTSRELRDALPDPQTLLIVAFFVLFAVAMALVAMRASRVIARKMRPLVEAASHIERQDLDFAVGSTNVREINEVLSAMERMRSALDESLRAQWAADEARRRQVSALAHDLKTPLAIARWNADLLRETPLDHDQDACAEALADSVGRMDGYVRLLVETSRTGEAPMSRENVQVSVLAAQVERQARQLCEAQGLVLDCSCEGDDAMPADAAQLVRADAAQLVQGDAAQLEQADAQQLVRADAAQLVRADAAQLVQVDAAQLVRVDAQQLVRADATQLVRAVMNLVSNAAQYAPPLSTLLVRFSLSADLLRIVVEDEGPGFTPAALEHGKERFFRGAADRGSEGGHYGLGLSIVDDIATAHGGTLTLANRESGGARCTLEVPSHGK